MFLVLPLSLLLHLTKVILRPLYNTLPLNLHSPLLYVYFTILPSLVYWQATLRRNARLVISGRVCFSIAALAGDVLAVSGRRIGSLSGRLVGPEWGAFGARAVLGMGVVGGGTGFALLCFVSYLSLCILLKTNHPD